MKDVKINVKFMVLAQKYTDFMKTLKNIKFMKKTNCFSIGI